MKRLWLRLGLLSCTGLLAMLCLLVGLGGTEVGLKALVAAVQLASGGALQCGAARGTLFTTLQLDDIRVSTADAEIKLARIGYSWRAGELFAGRLHLERLSAQGLEIRLLPGESTSGPVVLAPLLLPGEVQVDRLELDGLVLLDTDHAELTRIDQLSLSLTGKDGVYTLADLVVRAPGYDGDLALQLDTARDWRVKLAGKVEYRDYGVGPFGGDVRAEGPLARLDVAVDLHYPATGHIIGQIMELPNDFKWTADLDLVDVQLADWHEVLPEMRFSLAGQANGQQLEYGGTLQGNLDYLFFHQVDAVFDVHGNEDQIEFNTVTAENTHGKAALTDGLLSWKDDLVWRGHLVTEGFDPAMILADYPGAIDAELDSSGSYGEKNGLFLKADVTRVSGLLRGYRFEGRGRLESDPRQVRIDELVLTSGAAGLTLNGRAESAESLVDWQQSLTWQGNLQLKDFDPGLLLVDYPGSLDGSVVTAGTIVAGVPTGTAEIERLTGKVRGFPVEGKGRVQLAGERLDIENLLLKSGRTLLEVNGTAGDLVDITASFSSKDLGELLAGGHGAVQLAATLKGERQRPRFTVTGEAGKLGWQDLLLNRLQLDVSGGIDGATPVAVKLQGRGLRSGGFTVNQAELALDGLMSQHRFTASLTLPDGTVSLAGKGALAEDSSWQGQISDLRLNHRLSGTWRQSGHSEIAASATRVTMSPLCLAAAGEKLCGEGGWSADTGGWQLKVDGEHLDLARLSGIADLPESVQGQGRIALQFAGDQSAIHNGSGKVELRQVHFGDGKGDSDLDGLALNQADFTVTLARERLDLDLVAAFVNGSSIKSKATIAGFGSFAASPLELPLTGTVQANVRDLAFLAPLSGYYLRPTGTLTTSLRLAGRVGSPAAQGTIQLKDGQLELLTLGITLRDLSCTLDGGLDGVDLQTTAISGQGKLMAAGRLQMVDGGVHGDIRITGEDLDTANLPEYVLRTSPDLRFVFDQGGGSLTGRVEVVKGMIAPEEMTGHVGVSDDMVYMDGEKEEARNGWPVTLALQIELGDDLQFDGYGISGFLRGGLRVSMKPGSAMQGQGQLSLAKGKFSLYGRTLAIERSRLLFAGGPIDNPGIDVRAKKVVADNKRPGKTIEVGVDVSGTVDNLEFTLFSNPMMEESDILAYMVVGRAMSDVGEQDTSLVSSAAMALGLDKKMGPLSELIGLLPVDDVYLEGDKEEDMSLVVGKHLTRQLYIGYGHNFFNQEGEVRLRYDLGSGFAIETRSSGERTGTDLVYSFDR
ncbi:MAG: translocation/assembly module TamB domain-containing protein [Desulfopila sp.]